MQPADEKPSHPKRKGVVIAGLSVLVLVFVLSTFFLNRPEDWTRTEQGKALLAARASNSPNALRQVINLYPNSTAAKAAASELPAAMLKEARRTLSTERYRELLKDYPDSKEAAEARAELPAALLSEARRRESIAALRSVIQEFPDSPEAQQAKEGIHSLYEQAQARYRARFQTETPQTTFVQRLCSYLEQNGPKIEVRYITFKGKTGEFTRHEPYSWESDVMQEQLPTLFEDYRNDSIQLEKGDALDESATIANPTIAIQYVIRSNDSMYSSKGGGFAVGDDVTLNISLRIPNEELKIDLYGSGRTPSRFKAPNDDAFMVTSRLAIEAAMAKIRSQFLPAIRKQQNAAN